MKKLLFALLAATFLVQSPLTITAAPVPAGPEAKAKPATDMLAVPADMSQYLQNISVTIRATNGRQGGEGSGVIFSRKDKAGNVVNFVWTAAHVVDILRTERRVVVRGSTITLVEFKDAQVVKVIRQNGRAVGIVVLDAEVIKYSEADKGHDLALLRIRKLNFISSSASFYLGKGVPPLGTPLYHVGSLLGQFGSNSMTDGIYSSHGRVIPEINKKVFDQTTVAAFPGSSGGGVYEKRTGRYVGMLVRGAGETFNLIVPVRRMVAWATANELMWALDASVPMPDKFDKLNIETVGVKLEK